MDATDKQHRRMTAAAQHHHPRGQPLALRLTQRGQIGCPAEGVFYVVKLLQVDRPRDA